MANIGKPQRVWEVKPVENPVPQKQPEQVPEPVKVPEREPVPVEDFDLTERAPIRAPVWW